MIQACRPILKQFHVCVPPRGRVFNLTRFHEIGPRNGCHSGPQGRPPVAPTDRMSLQIRRSAGVSPVFLFGTSLEALAGVKPVPRHMVERLPCGAEVQQERLLLVSKPPSLRSGLKRRVPARRRRYEDATRAARGGYRRVPRNSGDFHGPLCLPCPGCLRNPLLSSAVLSDPGPRAPPHPRLSERCGNPANYFVRSSTRTSITMRPHPPHSTPTSEHPTRLKAISLGSTPAKTSSFTASTAGLRELTA